MSGIFISQRILIFFKFDSIVLENLCVVTEGKKKES